MKIASPEKDFSTPIKEPNSGLSKKNIGIDIDEDEHNDKVDIDGLLAFNRGASLYNSKIPSTTRAS